MIRSELKHLMLIGAYRDNEVDATHPLARKLEAIRNAGASLQEVKLAPSAARTCVSSLRTRFAASQRAPPRWWSWRTRRRGNPFFVAQFLSALADEGLLTFDHDWRTGHGPRAHPRKGFTANVRGPHGGKLGRLPARTQEALQHLACLGNSADLTTLASCAGRRRNRSTRTCGRRFAWS